MPDRSTPPTLCDGAFYSRVTLNETAKNIGVLSWTPKMKLESVIHTPKRDNDYPRSFQIGVPSPPLGYVSLIHNSMQN